MDTELSTWLRGGPPPLRDRIASRTAVVGLVGLGYVGLPLALAAAQESFSLIGVDADPVRIDRLRSGQSYIEDVTGDDMVTLRAAEFSTDPCSLTRADVIILAVPTPLADGVPDLTLVRRASQDVVRAMRPGQLIILESTTYPGTTQEIVLPILETSGLEVGRDFFLGYSPERIDPGRSRSFRATPKIVSGVGPEDTELVRLFYSQLVDQVVVTPTPREAEMAKLLENTFRQVNIALINELAMLAPDLGVDIWAAIEAAATKPFGFMPFWPGPGVGGHCISIDPSYLSWRVGQRLGFGIRFVEHAKTVNNGMPAYVVHRIAEALNQSRKPVNGSRVMAIGLSYKADVKDVRESPSIAVVERLLHAGAISSYHDPYVPSVRLQDQTFVSQPLDPKILATQDCVVILTPHEAVDYQRIVAAAPMVFDSCGITRRFLDAPNVIRL